MTYASNREEIVLREFKTHYAGIGSRQTPPDICALMTEYAKAMGKKGFVLRSGAADGADSAFEAGSPNKEIFLPVRGYKGRDSLFYPEKCDIEDLRFSIKLAKEFYGSYNWKHANEFVRRLMTRNVWQVLGFDCITPSEFVVCWTSDGLASGGTGQAIRIANHYNIPVYNLKTDINKFEKEIL